MVKFLQINVGVGRAAQDLVLASDSLWGFDIIIFSEQNRSLQVGDGCIWDASGLSAVVVVGSIPINSSSSTEHGFCRVEFPDFRLYSCYWTPNCSTAEFSGILLRLELSIRTSRLPVVVAGDFNAKSRVWVSLWDDAKGSLLADLVAALDLSACYEGSAPTFVRGTSSSHIDVTFALARIRGKVNNQSP